MQNKLLTIGPVTLYGYGLMIAIGIFFAYRLLEYRARKHQFDVKHISSLTLWGLLGGFIGAKLLYWITQFPNIISNPRILLNIGEGYVVYGGIIGGILAGLLYCKIQHLPFLKHLDLFAPSIALAQGFGRIGCLLAGCCYGAETNSWFGITFHHSDIAPNGVALVPTQIMESVFSFGVCILLLLVAKRTKKVGLVACAYLILYSAGRFIIEFFRGDIIRGEVGILSTSQFIALLIVLIASLILILQKYQNQWMGKNA
ncbi:prolipoprotein diacylglyceryl transferase [Sporosarcina sp. Te-1]|uniref:prolipoprotein diacylglyceryl transferase n=1 Tax=Sporosarcina sp. Te-1 TaxID=2818390 RepID=UPI001A9D85E9|nr:prolipoprotein diacylglyceryl transferase [Sporosarcina sp. Te-1]QTD41854.1 prolipoprotein diacylglyceryl transferase [Sporosarcina sp. Te-1]